MIARAKPPDAIGPRDATLLSMARTSAQIDELAQKISALPTRERVRLFEKVLTPEMELRLVAERLRSKTDRHDRRTVDRAVDQAVREVRRARGTRAH